MLDCERARLLVDCGDYAAFPVEYLSDLPCCCSPGCSVLRRGFGVFDIKIDLRRFDLRGESFEEEHLQCLEFSVARVCRGEVFEVRADDFESLDVLRAECRELFEID